MEDIHIKASKGNFIQPSVDFDAATGECSISGESFLEETAKFYTPLVNWIHNYFKTNNKIVFTFKLTYFNTSTSKWIFTMLTDFRKYKDSGCDVVVNWYFHEEDVDMRDDIMNYMEDTGLSINLVPFSE